MTSSRIISADTGCCRLERIFVFGPACPVRKGTGSDGRCVAVDQPDDSSASRSAIQLETPANVTAAIITMPRWRKDRLACP